MRFPAYVPDLELPADLRSRFDLHEGHSNHAICGVRGHGVSLTVKKITRGDWSELREHACGGAR